LKAWIDAAEVLIRYRSCGRRTCDHEKEAGGVRRRAGARAPSGIRRRPRRESALTDVRQAVRVSPNRDNIPNASPPTSCSTGDRWATTGVPHCHALPSSGRPSSRSVAEGRACRPNIGPESARRVVDKPRTDRRGPKSRSSAAAPRECGPPTRITRRVSGTCGAEPRRFANSASMGFRAMVCRVGSSRPRRVGPATRPRVTIRNVTGRGRKS